MSNTPLNDGTLPPTITIGKGATMTFLRNEAYLARVQVNAQADLEEDALYVPPHWHETHDELFRVIKGRLEVMIGSVKRFYVPEDGEVRIPKGVIHSLRVSKGEECIFEERTEPMDDEKELFFRNFVDDGKLPSNVFQAMQVAYYGDMRPVLPGHIPLLEKAFVTILGRFLAPLLGYRLKYTSLKKGN